MLKQSVAVRTACRATLWRLTLVLVVLALQLACLSFRTPDAFARSYSRTQLAKNYFKQGERNYRDAEFQKALEAYRMALKYRRLPAFFFNIAQCYRELSRYDRAIFYFKLYLHHAPNASNRGAVLAMISKLEVAFRRQEAQRHKLATAVLQIRTTPPGAQVFLDGELKKPIGTAPINHKLKPGRHVLTFRLQGHAEQQRLVTVKPGREMQIDVVLLKQDRRRVVARRRSGADPAPALPKGPTSPYRRWWVATGFVLSAVAGVAAIVTGAKTLEKADAYSKMFASEPGAAALKREAERLRTATDILIGVAAVGVIATTTALIIAVGRWRRDRRKRLALRIIPACTVTGCVVGLAGKF